jgi:hypothetical protein
MVSAMESMGGVRLSPYCWLDGAVEGMMEKPYAYRICLRSQTADLPPKTCLDIHLAA